MAAFNVPIDKRISTPTFLFQWQRTFNMFPISPTICTEFSEPFLSVICHQEKRIAHYDRGVVSKVFRFHLDKYPLEGIVCAILIWTGMVWLSIWFSPVDTMVTIIGSFRYGLIVLLHLSGEIGKSTVLFNTPGQVTYMCTSELGQLWFRYWLVTYSAPTHYLNRNWLIAIGQTLRN